MDGKILCNGTYYYAAVKTICMLRMLRIIIIFYSAFSFSFFFLSHTESSLDKVLKLDVLVF